MIKVENATQVYQAQTIFAGVNVSIHPGERIAIVGRNGAGKTTLLHSLLGFSRLQNGNITIDGKSVRRRGAWQGKLSYLPEKFQLYVQLTAEENLAYFAGKLGYTQEEIERVLNLTNMYEQRHKRINQLSKGMLQRMGLSITLLGDPQILVLDEPTSGLDPFGRADFMQIMQQISTKDRTMLFTTHFMDEVRQLATHVLFLHNGQAERMLVTEFFQTFEGRLLV